MKYVTASAATKNLIVTAVVLLVFESSIKLFYEKVRPWINRWTNIYYDGNNESKTKNGNTRFILDL